MTKELIENIRAIIVPYMAHDLKRINYENMGEIDAEQFSEDMNEILDLAAKALEQQPIIDVNVPHKIAEFFSNWDGDENAKMEISVNDMREIADIFRKKARAERQLTEKALDYNPNEWCHDCKEYDNNKHCCPRFNNVIRKTVEEIKQSKTGHWIPVSERLPKQQEKTYWICTDCGYQCECRWTNVNHFWTELTTDWHWHIMDVPQYQKVVAWMPLPKPYEPQESEDKE